MKTALLVLSATLAAAAGGCATVDQSRNLNDPSVPGHVLAAQVCSNCHGLNGNSVSPNFPRLAGQPAGYLASQLTQFRSHNRSDPAGFVYMWGLSRHLTDAQIEDLAKYFSSQTPHPNVPGDSRFTQKGQDIFENGISSGG
ncbi:MAG TPA: cytochrome c, partial [Usitatibacter sp.]